ncbi:hypothetical protein [Halopiger djelfimassiliensis]|uniref:hypothetical protein n=1 Tax=Halopiger djelfimassiliensis TaxID=1293047 RepID=UPI000AEF9968|nr:hypothetical protein [Halopiger djelfimassiliensis]
MSVSTNVVSQFEHVAGSVIGAIRTSVPQSQWNVILEVMIVGLQAPTQRNTLQRATQR